MDAAHQARIALTCLRFVHEAGVATRGDRDAYDAFILSAIANASLSPVNRDAQASTQFGSAERPAPDEAMRPISINAVAQSLDMPFETVRRRAAGLAREGLIASTPTGVVVLASTTSSAAYTAMLEANYRLAGAFYRDLRRLGVAPAPSATDDDLSSQGPLIRVVGRAISDYFPRTVQALIPLGGSLPTASVLVETVLANTTDMDDVALDAWVRTAGRSGQPVSVVEVAHRFFLSRETARRHVHLLEELGLIVRVRRGLLAVATAETRARLVEIAQANVADTRRFFATLDRAGVLADWASPQA